MSADDVWALVTPVPNGTTATPPPRPPEPSSARLRRVDVGRMLREPPPEVPWVVEGLLARGALSLFPGREGVGKSLFVMALVVGVVTGEAAGPFSTTPGRVMVVDAENGEGELHRRLRALGLAAGAEEALSIYLTESGDVLNVPDELAAVVAHEAPDLVVIDSLRSNWRGRENDSDEIGPSLDRLRNLARNAGCAVALIHHAGKIGGEYRGSTAIGAACEIVVGIGRHADDPEPDRFVLTCQKMRPAPRWDPKWIRLAVEMGLIVELEAAEAFTSDDLPPPPKAPAREALAPQIARVLAHASGPLQRAEIARAVDRDQRDRTVGRVLEEMEARGAARRLEDGRWRGWQPHEALKGAATPATPPRRPSEAHGQADPSGGSQPATAGPPATLFRPPSDPDAPTREGAP